VIDLVMLRRASEANHVMGRLLRRWITGHVRTGGTFSLTHRLSIEKLHLKGIVALTAAQFPKTAARHAESSLITQQALDDFVDVEITVKLRGEVP
jgi:hypothetical protein